MVSLTDLKAPIDTCLNAVRSWVWPDRMTDDRLPWRRRQGVLSVPGSTGGASRRLRLLYNGKVCVGTTLDVPQTAEELAQAVVPGFAEFVIVELAEAVLAGDELRPGDNGTVRRVAVSGVLAGCPVHSEDRRLSLRSPAATATSLDGRQTISEARPNGVPGQGAQALKPSLRNLACGVHSLITLPLMSRGAVLGVVHFWRSQQNEAFTADDLAVAEEFVAYGAVCVDNAYRYTREHTVAMTLQRSLLPRCLPQQNALDIAYRYLPAQAGVGGDWFDVIPLPGARVALVVGDVVGHGLHAAATMGRLRTAVLNFSSLDLQPDEIFRHLDELISVIDCDDAAFEGDDLVTGATCLYVIYDPASRHCVMSRAGHLPPALVRADGSVQFPDIPVGPPLGLGNLPGSQNLSFENTECEVPDDAQLVLYTDGLVEDRTRDIDDGLVLLGKILARGGRCPEETCAALVEAMLPARQSDDIALLVARTRGLRVDQVAEWDVPLDPEVVPRLRAAVLQTMREWDLNKLSFATELIITELSTNAIRHGNGPIHLRLIRDRSLICEVSDCSSTPPHLRRAAETDEGGRGLMLVAGLAHRWGTRYTSAGKIIWTEQRLP